MRQADGVGGESCSLFMQQSSWRHKLPQKVDAFVWKAACHADVHWALPSVISERKELSKIIIQPQSQLCNFKNICMLPLLPHMVALEEHGIWIHVRCSQPHKVRIISRRSGRLPECQVICTAWTDCIIICWLSWKESWQCNVIRFSRAGKCMDEDAGTWGPYQWNF